MERAIFANLNTFRVRQFFGRRDCMPQMLASQVTWSLRIYEVGGWPPIVGFLQNHPESFQHQDSCSFILSLTASEFDRIQLCRVVTPPAR